MAWLTDYETAPRIDMGFSMLAGSMFFGTPGSGQWRRLITETRYKLTCLTSAAAQEGAVAIQGASDWDTVIVAVVEPQNEAGAFQIVVCQTETEAWEQET